MFITTKGQVTIPQSIREAFGFLPNSEVEFEVKHNRVYLVKPVTHTRGKSLISTMRGKGDVRMSTDEILALTRGHARE